MQMTLPSLCLILQIEEPLRSEGGTALSTVVDLLGFYLGFVTGGQLLLCRKAVAGQWAL